MKPLLNIIRYSILAVAVILLCLVALTAIYKERVAEVFIKEISRRSNIKTSVSEVRLTLLKRFPKASFELREVLIVSVDGFTGNDTLIATEMVALDFSITDLLRKNYTIERINISNGIINTLTDKNGQTNYPEGDIWTSDNSSDLNINITSVRLSDIVLTVNNSLKGSRGIIKINNAHLSGAITGSDIDLKMTSDFVLSSLIMNGIDVKQPVNASTSLKMHRSDSLITMTDGSLTLEGISFALKGHFAPATGKTDIAMQSYNADIKAISGFLPEKYQAVSKYRPEGKTDINGEIAGVISKTGKLLYNFSFEVRQVKAIIPGTDLRIHNSSLRGTYTNGVNRNAESSVIKFSDILINTDSSSLSGMLQINNLLKPVTEGNITAIIDAKEITPLIKTPGIKELKGQIRVSLKASGKLPAGGDKIIPRILDMNPTGIAYLTEVEAKTDNYIIENVNGHVTLSDNLWIDDMNFILNGQSAIVDAEVKSFIKLLRGESEQLIAKGKIVSDSFEPSLWFNTKTDSIRVIKQVSLPYGYNISLDFYTDIFKHKTFSAEPLKGVLQYNDGVITIDTFSMGSMNGNIQGSAVLAGIAEGGFHTDSRLAFADVDINSAFDSFKNFGQDFINAQNLKGTITGRYSMRMNLDEKLKPISQSISSEGRFIITDGELINFTPVMSMSKYIDITELQNIRFSKMENEFFIQSGIFAIPQMDINSSAANLGISGVHLFNGDYEYNIRLLLSQILSKKAPKRTPNNEFGIVEDDGLGRTSVFLKVSRTDGVDNVVYDIDAARNSLKEDLREEKQTLRTILNEEFGWFDDDTTMKTIPVKEKARFKIKWDEGIQPPDTTTPDTIKTEKKGGSLKRLINKIIKG